MPIETLPVWRRMAVLAKLLAVALALAGQICAGAVAAPADGGDGPRNALDAAMVFCQSGHGKGKQAPAHRGLADQAAVRVAASAIHPAALPVAEPFLPPPPRAEIGAARRPQARAPPSRFSVAAQARAPPHLI